jgi:uncharacterized sporulation protein YeaH/YhbH (DUF444 family)
MNIIDRRSNPGNKSLPNLQRYKRRAKEAFKEAVADAAQSRSIRDKGNQKITVKPKSGTHEPTLRRSSTGGKREYVLPGNKEYVPGDTIPRPQGGGGKPQASDSGDGTDEFIFTLSREEFLDLLFEDMELPDMVQKRLLEDAATKRARAGFSSTGNTAQLDIKRTAIKAMGRRVALNRPKPEDVAAAEEKAKAFADDDTSPEAEEARKVVAGLKGRMRAIPWIDTTDVRYRRYEPKPNPTTKAVMFCVMDVSGSMTEHMKDLAKRFYTLLYLFLEREYETIDVVFIRHTEHAREVEEDEFFHARDTGGTIVSSGLELMKKIADDRFPAADYNRYAAQISDGDNIIADRDRTTKLMNDILPDCQYFAYLEVAAENASHNRTDLWDTYENVADAHSNLAMRRAQQRNEVYPVLRDLFKRKGWDSGAPARPKMMAMADDDYTP